MDNAIIEKLQRILTFANGSGGSQHETETALAAARALAVKHNIDLATVDLGGEEDKSGAIEVGNETVQQRSKYVEPHHSWVYQILREVFQVRTILYSHHHNNRKIVSRVLLIGETFDLAVAKQVMPFLEGVFPRLYRQAVRRAEIADCRAAMNGFYSGLAQGILEVNRREEEQVTAGVNNYALVIRRKDDIVAAKMAELCPNLKTTKSPGRTVAQHAVASGYRAGQQINLRQLGGTGGPRGLKNS